MLPNWWKKPRFLRNFSVTFTLQPLVIFTKIIEKQRQLIDKKCFILTNWTERNKLTWAWAFRDVNRKSDPNNVPTPITDGIHSRETTVMYGDIKKSVTEHPIIWVAALKPPEMVCLKLLLKSWISAVNLNQNIICLTNNILSTTIVFFYATKFLNSSN